MQRSHSRQPSASSSSNVAAVPHQHTGGSHHSQHSHHSHHSAGHSASYSHSHPPPAQPSANASAPARTSSSLAAASAHRENRDLHGQPPPPVPSLPATHRLESFQSTSSSSSSDQHPIQHPPLHSFARPVVPQHQQHPHQQQQPPQQYYQPPPPQHLQPMQPMPTGQRTIAPPAGPHPNGYYAQPPQQPLMQQQHQYYQQQPPQQYHPNQQYQSPRPPIHHQHHQQQQLHQAYSQQQPPQQGFYQQPQTQPQQHFSPIVAPAAPPHPLPDTSPSAQRTPRIDTSLPLDQLRATTMQSLDPEAHLDFVRYLVSLADEVAATTPDPRAASKQIQQLYAEALKWVKRLATHGPGGLNGQAKTPPFADAMVYLAECHGNALLGLTLDHDKAFSLYMQASKLGHAGATYRVAVCYEIGAGTKRDTHRAVQFFKKAASLGDPAALYKLGVVLLYGELGYAANPREGLVMLKRAAAVADADHPHALHELAMVHEPDPPGGRDPRLREIQHLVLPDPAYALQLYTQASKLGYAPAQFRLGTCFEEGDLGCPRDPKTSIMWFTRAAEQGHPDAELALSGWYLEGAEGVLPPDDGQAFAWARRAADKGLSKAEFAVAYYYEMGVGVGQNIEEARRWYQRSAAQGNRKAMERLQEMNSSMKASYKQVKRQKEDCVVM